MKAKTIVLTLLAALLYGCGDPGTHEIQSWSALPREIIENRFGSSSFGLFFSTSSENLYDFWARQSNARKLKGSVSEFLDWNDVSTIFAIYNTWHLPVQGKDPRIRHIEENLIEATFGDRFKGSRPDGAYILLLHYEDTDRKVLLSFKDGRFFVQDDTGTGAVDITGPGTRENESSGALPRKGGPQDVDSSTKGLLSNDALNAPGIGHRNGFVALRWLFSESGERLHDFWAGQTDDSKLEGPVSEFLDWHDVSSIFVLYNGWHLLGGGRDMRMRHIEENLTQATFGDRLNSKRDRLHAGGAYVFLLHYRDSDRRVLLCYGDEVFIVEDRTGIGVVDIYDG